MQAHDPTDNDVIQLYEDAVRERLPPYATEDDMYEALELCGMTQGAIFEALDRRGLGNSSPTNMAIEIITILFEAFDATIDQIVAHRIPVQL